VAQNTFLINKSIFENITMGLSDVSEEEVKEACKIVNIHDEIIQMFYIFLLKRRWFI